jgi:hypothetical protein
MRTLLTRVLTASVLLLGLSGCLHSAGDLCYVNLGASRSQVIQSLGAPASASASKNVEIFRYELLTAQSNTGNSENAAAKVESYFVRIIDGTVESYGKWSDLPPAPPQK